MLTTGPNFSAGHAGAADWRVALQQALEAARPLPSGANLGFVYVTDAVADDFEQVVSALRNETGVEHWVGTVGLGVCATGIEYYDQPAVCVLLGRFADDSFRVFSSLANGFDGFDRKHSDWCAAHQPFFGVVHADPRNAEIPSLVAALSDRMQSGFLVGGLASASRRFTHLAGAVEEGGLSGVLFDPSVSVSTRLSQGCTPLGRRHHVTQADQNLVFELDGRPALEVLKEDVGEVIARDLSRAGGYIFVGLPIQGVDTGDYLVRNLIGIDPKEGIVAIGDQVCSGDSLMFCRRDGTSAVQDLERMLAELKSSMGGPPSAAIYTSCIGRGTNLFGPGSEELKLVEAALGPVPLVGFYANGEICHDRLYGYTGVLTLFA